MRYANLLGIGCVLGLGSMLFGAGPESEGKPAAPDRPVLRGPAVQDEQAPGTRRGFVGGPQRGDIQTSERFLQQVLESMLADGGLPPAVALTEAQVKKFSSMRETFVQSRRKFMREHRAEMNTLREQAGMGRGRQTDRARRPSDAPMPDAMDDGMRDGMTDEAMDSMLTARQAAREQLRKLESESPQFTALWAQVWDGLSEPQQAHVQLQIDEQRARQAKEREEAYVRRQLGDRAPAGERPERARPEQMRPESMEPDAMRPDVARREARPGVSRDMARDLERISPERRERIVRLFASMTPQEQDRVLQMLEGRFGDRVRDGGGDGEAPRRRPQADRPSKRAPSIDDVEVPKPEPVESPSR